MEEHVMFTGVFGSTLYGLTNESSDMDYKSISISPLNRMLFNKQIPAEDNHSDTMDSTKYSIAKFMEMLGKSDIVSLDMLHTPKEFTTSTSLLWSALRELRGDIYSKALGVHIEHIPLKLDIHLKSIQKRNGLALLKDYLEGIPSSNRIVNHRVNLLEVINNLPGKPLSVETDSYSVTIDGNVFHNTSHMDMLLTSCNAKLSRYSKKSNTVTDKFLSHCVRILLEIEYIINHRDLDFLKIDFSYVAQIKNGEVPLDDVIDYLIVNIPRVLTELNISDLPDEPNVTNMENLIIGYLINNWE